MNFLVLSILILSASTCSLKSNITVIVQEISIHSKISNNYTINSNKEYILSVTELPDNLSISPPQIHVDCASCSKLNPALIISNNREISYNKTERTLCIYNENNSCKDNVNEPDVSQLTNEKKNKTLIVSLSTSSKKNITLSIQLKMVTDFLLWLDMNKTIELTPESPRFYFYNFSDDIEESAVILKTKSDSNNCMIVSVQNNSCPVIDIGYAYGSGYFQTINYQGAMTIFRAEFPLGFYAVFSLTSDDTYCHNPSGWENNDRRIKLIDISLSKTISKKIFFYVVIGTLGVILFIYVFVLSIYFFVLMRKDVTIPELNNLCDLHEASTSDCMRKVSVFQVESENHGSHEVASPLGDDTLSIKTDSSLDETDVDVLNDIQLDKNIFRTKVTLYLSDLAKKNPTALKKKSELYFWNVMTAAIFYILPASQLVYAYQNAVASSGNEDLCYYNHLCSHRLGKIFDFNHFFSNIGYVALGFLFLIITWRKSHVNQSLISKNILLQRNYGVPLHCGLYYAMGTSLIFEGFLSATYHLCPNKYNFQFDATFMYIISTICMIKIYQSRHPDVNAAAYSTFFLIGFVLFFAICGVFLSFSPLFWFIFTAAHIGTIFYISLHIYYVGIFDLDFRSVIRYFKEFQFQMCRTVEFWSPTYKKRFVLIGMINLINWAMAIAGLVIGITDVSSYLLIIFVTNLMLYSIFYIIMKILCGEKILFQPSIYITLAVICWSAALHYFTEKTISWKKTPPESMTYNKPCVLFDFYDNHDIWHFLSSAGLFFSFLFLLTLDDDLIFVHRSKIPVF